MNYTIECPKCGEEIDTEVDIGEHMVEWGEICDSCGYKFTQSEILEIYDKTLSGALGAMIDRAHDMYGDR
jgi:hypothetical protein